VPFVNLNIENNFLLRIHGVSERPGLLAVWRREFPK
jgi:hypothetical protein